MFGEVSLVALQTGLAHARLGRADLARSDLPRPWHAGARLGARPSPRRARPSRAHLPASGNWRSGNIVLP